MKIGELAQKTGVSRDTIRLYEQMGLLGRVSRPHEFNNYKEYGEENIQRILMVKKMQKFGITLKESSEVVKAIDNDEFGDKERNELFSRKMEIIDNKIKELTILRESLSQMLNRQCTTEDKSREQKMKNPEYSQQA